VNTTPNIARAAGRGDVRPGQFDLAVRLGEPGDDPERCGLPHPMVQKRKPVRAPNE